MHITAHTPIIMVDIDDTLYDFDSLYRSIARRDYGLIITDDHKTSWEGLSSIMATLDSPHDEPLTAFFRVLHECYTEANIASTVPFDHSLQTLAELADAGHALAYVSDRPAVAQAATQAWLRDHGMPHADFLVCSDDKRAWIAEHAQQLVTVIDDRPRTLLHVLETTPITHVHGLVRHWNRSDLIGTHGVHLADTWHQIRANIRRELGIA